MRVLVTGGAGFIGSHLGGALVRRGHAVTVLDNLSPQVHGEDPRPALAPGIELRRGSVLDGELVAALVEESDAVVHLAAETGTGQSMYEARRYAEVNVAGTACLLDALVSVPRRPRRVLLTSSRAVYGEGACGCAEHGAVLPEPRRPDDLRAGRWDARCPHCERPVEAIPTDESWPLRPVSVYGSTKQAQEQLLAIVGDAVGLEWTTLRLQNVYGPGQSLRNPYTGLLAVFFALLRAGRPIEIYEDGQESRDFVFVDDVAEAICLALTSAPPRSVYNVGSGQATTVQRVAELMREACGSTSELSFGGRYREGDIRHCVADVAAIERELGWRPTVGLEEGLQRFVDWAARQPELEGDPYGESVERLARFGLMGRASSAPDSASPSESS